MQRPDNDRGRPLAGPAPKMSNGDTSSLTDQADKSAVSRRGWAHGLIRKAQSPLPTYGSPEWLALPEGSATKVAAVVVAAEAWASEADDLAERLRCQLEAERQAFKRAEDADFQERARAHREQWSHLGHQSPRYAGQLIRPLEEIGAAHTGRRPVTESRVA